jgi:hypothetical protein
MKDVNGHLELGPTKTHATRTVSLPTFLKEMLRTSQHLVSKRHRPGGVRLLDEGRPATPHGAGSVELLQVRRRRVHEPQW